MFSCELQFEFGLFLAVRAISPAEPFNTVDKSCFVSRVKHIQHRLVNIQDLSGFSIMDEYGITGGIENLSVIPFTATQFFKKLLLPSPEIVPATLLDQVADLREALKGAMAEVKADGRHSVLLMLTDVVKEGTDLVVLSDDDALIEKAFGGKLENSSMWIDGMMSRKKQTVPNLQGAFGC